MLPAFRSRLLPACAGAAGLAAAYWSSPLWQASSWTALADAPAPSALSPDEWRSFKVAEKTQITANTARYRFALPDPRQVVGLPVASCLVARAPIGSENPDGTHKWVIRPYTPTSLTDARGHFDLVIKSYPEGKMSKHIGDLQVGDTLECKGPIPKIKYTANMKKRIGMVAGGTGVTPMLQVVSEILRNPDDKTEVSLVFGNQTEKDIILKKEIDALAKQHRNFKVYYIVDKAGSLFWRGGVGYVTADTLKAHLPPPSDDNLILVCGPPGMMKAVSGDKEPDKSQGPLTGLLKQLGYTESQVFKF